MGILKYEIKSFFNAINTLRITMIAAPSVATIWGVLKSSTFLFGFGVGFVVAALMIAIVAYKYG